MRTISDERAPRPRRRRVLTKTGAVIPRPRPRRQLIIGVDGEGADTPDGRHIYTYIAAVDEHGELRAEARNPGGLTHEECVLFLLSLPRGALVVGFMFSYDVCKIVEDLSPEDIYCLMRPQAREEHACSRCRKVTGKDALVCPNPSCAGDVKVRTRRIIIHGRRYDFFNGSLTIRDKAQMFRSVGEKRTQPRQTKVWDVFRFYGCGFVVALELWKIGSEAQRARIRAMKEKRGSHTWGSDAAGIEAYCREECELLAVMVRELKEAHETAGIPLKRYDGAGSTASSLLTINAVGEFRGPRLHELDPRLQVAIASAFFGGRFECSTIGVTHDPIEGFDISSAYPYALTHLPCLACGGRWRRVTGATRATLSAGALVVAQYAVRPKARSYRQGIAWCPLPCRDEKGSICYGTNFMGWAWAQELLPALEGWPELVVLTGEAWVFEARCDHKPFDFLPAVYRERCRWGKDGPGIVLKLGPNACYGKCSQMIGDDPPFQCWPWAGACTATTRGQLLRAILSARDPWSVWTTATDGIYGTERLPIGPPPIDTGTGDLEKPLGGWEHKSIPEGIFVCKPGMYYRHKRELSDVRARGLGRRELFEQGHLLEAAFARWDREDPKFHVPLESRRFFGAKHSVLGYSRCRNGHSWAGVPQQGCKKCAAAGKDELGVRFEAKYVRDKKTGEPVIGRWGMREVKIGFDPHPKRERDGLSKEGTFTRLTIRDLGGIVSAPYDVGTRKTSPEGTEARKRRDFDMEQPDYG